MEKLIIAKNNKVSTKEKRKYYKNITDERVGMVNTMNSGDIATIYKYNSAKDVIVQFKNGDLVTATYQRFMKGEIKSKLMPIVHGVGYIGYGEHIASVNRMQTKQYGCWCGMLERVYLESSLKRRPSYIGCSVCEEWLNFQNFAEWYDDNYYEVDDERMCLDKDILHKGNKVYSPENCVFVTNNINVLFIKHDKGRGEYPIGVSFRKRDNKYSARCKSNGILQHLGNHNTIEEAFDAYKDFKEQHIKDVAEEYKNTIPQNLYMAMNNYIVNIND